MKENFMYIYSKKDRLLFYKSKNQEFVKKILRIEGISSLRRSNDNYDIN